MRIVLLAIAGLLAIVLPLFFCNMPAVAIWILLAICALCIAALFFLLVIRPVAGFIGRRLDRKKLQKNGKTKKNDAQKGRKSNALRRRIGCAALFILAIFCLRYAVGFFEIKRPDFSDAVAAASEELGQVEGPYKELAEAKAEIDRLAVLSEDSSHEGGAFVIEKGVGRALEQLEQLSRDISKNDDEQSKALRKSVNRVIARLLPFESGSFKSASVFSEIFNGVVNTLQTFSLDEDFEHYSTAGNRMIRSLTNNNDFAAGFYMLISSAINVIAPIVGGAFVLALISEIFPSVRLWFSQVHFRKKKHYFSELNDRSLALAESILNSDPTAILVFTDAYVDEGDENARENLNAAKELGAICVKDDMQSLRFSGCKAGNSIYLIDAVENNNLQALASILSRGEKNKKIAGNTVIYVFSSDKNFSQIDEEVSYMLKDAGTVGGVDMPKVFPVSCMRNMTYSMLMRIPLFEPLVYKKPVGNKKRLVVTILGSGVIGTEFFRTIYWCGQMLGTELYINVVSKEKEEDFRKRINYINPDIFKTEETYAVNAAKKNGYGPEILKVYDDKEICADPYFRFSYYESDVLSEDFRGLMIGKKEKERDESRIDLIDTDYFIVALGSDEENFSVAERLREYVGIRHSCLTEKDCPKTVISYVVYNSELCRELRKTGVHYFAKNSGGDKKEPDVYLYPFGSMEEVYGLENALLYSISDYAKNIGKSYMNCLELVGSGIRKSANRVNVPLYTNIYNYHSDIARMAHRPYSEYSAGFHKKENSLFAACAKDPAKSEENYSAFKEKAHLEYIKMIFAVPAEKEVNGMKKQNMMNQLAWLEHRRWNAYMRSMGFRDEKELAKDWENKEIVEILSKKSKNIDLKIHACLVECDKSGMDAKSDVFGRRIVCKGEPDAGTAHSDRLDTVSGRYNCSYKIYDYPDREFERIIDEDLAKKIMNEKHIKLGENSVLSDELGVNIFVSDGEQFVELETLKGLVTRCVRGIMKKDAEILKYNKDNEFKNMIKDTFETLSGHDDLIPLKNITVERFDEIMTKCGCRLRIRFDKKNKKTNRKCRCRLQIKDKISNILKKSRIKKYRTYL